jgi:hypothetical protein
MSYNGHLGFGLLGDYDALPDLERIAKDLDRSIAALASAAGVAPGSKKKAARKATSARSGGAKRTARSSRRPSVNGGDPARTASSTGEHAGAG